MDEHQRRVLHRIVEQVDDSNAGRLPLDRLISNMSGLFEAADIRDRVLGQEFYLLWVQIDSEEELRTNPSIPPGLASDEHLGEALQELRSWAANLSDPQSDERE